MEQDVKLKPIHWVAVVVGIGLIGFLSLHESALFRGWMEVVLGAGFTLNVMFNLYRKKVSFRNYLPPLILGPCFILFGIEKVLSIESKILDVLSLGLLAAAFIIQIIIRRSSSTESQ